MTRSPLDDLPWGQTVNIARDHAVVGQMTGGRPAGAECFAWLRDEHDDLWLLVGPRPDLDGGLYALGGLGAARTLRDLNVSATGPVVWAVAR